MKTLVRFLIVSCMLLSVAHSNSQNTAPQLVDPSTNSNLTSQTSNGFEEGVHVLFFDAEDADGDDFFINISSSSSYLGTFYFLNETEFGRLSSGPSIDVTGVTIQEIATPVSVSSTPTQYAFNSSDFPEGFVLFYAADEIEWGTLDYSVSFTDTQGNTSETYPFTLNLIAVNDAPKIGDTRMNFPDTADDVPTFIINGAYLQDPHVVTNQTTYFRADGLSRPMLIDFLDEEAEQIIASSSTTGLGSYLLKLSGNFPSECSLLLNGSPLPSGTEFTFTDYLQVQVLLNNAFQVLCSIPETISFEIEVNDGGIAGACPDFHPNANEPNNPTQCVRVSKVIRTYEFVDFLPILYVDQNATGLNDGSTWGNAYTDLQSALAVANSSSIVEQIFIAEGTYLPSVPAGRDATFTMGEAELYGGFSPANGAVDIATRDATAYPTILSGDIGMSGVATDNAYTVVTSQNNGTNALLDGLIIQDGVTLNQFPNPGPQYTGGGLWMDNSSLTINNCVFRNNIATSGGAIAYSGFNNSKNLVINTTQFYNNSAFVYGGAVGTTVTTNQYNFSWSANNCLFYNNTALRGGVYGDAAITLPIFPGTPNINLDLSFTNCTLTENAATDGDIIFIVQSPNFGPSTTINLDIYNTLIWGNEDEGADDIVINDGTQNLTYSYNLMQGVDNTANNGLDGTNADNTPSFPNAASGNYAPACNGLVTDKGSNALVVGTTDVVGNDRIQNGDLDSTATVDIGAYEATVTQDVGMAQFASNPTIGCAIPHTVFFTDQSINGADTWAWDFGDGATSSLQYPVHNYTTFGDFQVKLTARNSLTCTIDETIQTIKVAQVNADFTASATATSCGNAIDFTDASTVLGNDTVASWLWDFGDGNTSTQQNPSHAYSGAGVYTVSLTTTLATTGCSNTEIKTAYITVTDASPPTITCPGNQTEPRDFITCAATLQDYAVLATTIDDCGTVTVTQNPLPGGFIFNPTTVTLTASDGNNSTSCSFIVTPIDITPPDVFCQNTMLQLDANGNATLSPSQIDAGSFDFCSGPILLSVSQTTFTCNNIGDNMVTLTATDQSGNSSTCIATVTVEDNVAPEVVCQDVTIQLDVNGNANIVAADIDGGSSDACGITSISVDIDAFDCTSIGDNDVILTVTDINGNSSTCTAVVTVEDNIEPIAVCQNITVQLDAVGTVSIVATDIDGGSTDNCDVATLAIDIDTFDCSNVGDNDVVLTVTDVNGNSSACTTTVTVEDNVNPSAVCQNITVELDALGMASIAAVDVDGGSTDNCDVATLAIDVDTFDCSNIGDNDVVLTVTDVNGNSSTSTATVTVEDNLPVTVITGPVDIFTGTGASDTQCETIVNYDASIDAFVLDDNCGDGSSTVTVTQTGGLGSGAAFPVGTTIEEYTLTDNNGNATIYTFEITVADTTAPMIDCPDDLIVGTENGTYIIEDYTVLASDNCSSGDDLVVTQEPLAGTELSEGEEATVTITATDAAGNTTECTFTLTVDSTLGVEEESFRESVITLYPVPTTGIINIDTNVQIDSAELYDVRGRLVLKKTFKDNSYHLNITNTKAGVYLVYFTSGDQIVVKRLIKE